MERASWGGTGGSAWDRIHDLSVFSHARSYGWVRSCGRHTGAILSEEETAGTDAPAVGRGVSGMFEYAAAGPANGTIVRRRDSGGI